MKSTSQRVNWRARTLWAAGGSLIRVGGTDLAASIAYYTLLSHSA